MNLGGSPVVTTCGHNRVAHEESNEKKIKVLLRSIVAEGEEFFLSTKTLLVPGFLEILYRNGSRESDHVLPPPLKVGDRFRLHNSSTDKDHQHATLLQACCCCVLGASIANHMVHCGSNANARY